MSDELDDLPDPRLHATGNKAAKIAPASSTARLIGRLYAASDRALRAKLLACLLRPLSPLARAAIAAGVFAKFVTSDSFESILAVMDEATRFSSEQIAELAHFVQQVSPEALDRFAQLATGNRAGTTGFGIAAGALLLKALADARTRVNSPPRNCR